MRGSPLPLLPIQPLADAGIFESAVDDGEPQEWAIRLPGLIALCTYLPEHEMLQGMLKAGNVLHRHWPQIDQAELQYGYRYYWLCEGCVKRCSTVVASDESYLCRDCYRREPGPFSTGHRNALLVEATEAIMLGQYSVEPMHRGRPRRAATVDRLPSPALPEVSASTSWRSHDMLTQTAIDRGQGFFQALIYDRVAAMTEEELFELPTLTGYERPATTMPLGQVPELDIRVLRQWYVDAHDKLIGYLLRWGENWDGPKAALFIDRRRPEPLWLIAHEPYKVDDPQWQRLTVVVQATGRLRFVCPVREVRCDVLYLRDGVFASSEAHRLIYPSQRAAGRKASARHG